MKLNSFIQNKLYLYNKKYKLNLLEYITKINDLNYVFIKVETPSQHKNFPKDYIIGTDLDILVVEADYTKMISRTLFFAKKYNFKIKKIEKENNTKIRLIFNKKLHFQFDISMNLYAADFLNSLLKQKVKKDFFLPKINDEVCIRYMEFISFPEKKHHLNYIINHFNENDNYYNFDILTFLEEQSKL